ncbi:NFATC2-interacting protein isoform X2 [Hypanus sabinus]|uniref:NFATC2-interacting protein isoform X2 n=1 Tax=Hypanus sabinus TaxID=79690 RepID=UPI0028C4A3F0|nr:NFATC2-interacting protein isoform X2 [Hypanus sabinus]
MAALEEISSEDDVVEVAVVESPRGQRVAGRGRRRILYTQTVTACTGKEAASSRCEGDPVEMMNVEGPRGRKMVGKRRRRDLDKQITNTCTSKEASSESEDDVLEVTEMEGPRGRRVESSRRRRVLDTHIVTTVPVYTGRVNRTLRLYQDNAAEVDKQIWKQLNLPDSDEDLEDDQGTRKRRRVSPEHDQTLHTLDSESEWENSHSLLLSPGSRSPSPPITPSLTTQQKGRAFSAIREMNRRLRDLDDFRGMVEGEAEDVLLLEPHSPPPLSPRLLSLKLRCQGLVHRIPIRVSDPFRKAVHVLANKLQMDPGHLLLLQNDLEVPLEQTPETWNLSVADILDCHVMSDSQTDTIRLQVRGREKDSLQTITIGKGEVLRSLMTVYKERTGLQRHRVCFLFDGAELSENSTPRDLDMEPDDVIDAQVAESCCL